MRQEEKSRITHEKIIDGAVAEFSGKGYESASINNICQDNHISKGLIYHHFSSKDELFLCCVSISFEKLMSFLNSGQYEKKNTRYSLKQLFELRYRFFRENPDYGNIFFNVVLNPPEHLKGRIGELRSPLDEFHKEQFGRILENVKLRDTISKQEAMGFFFTMQEMFNGYFQRKVNETAEFSSVVEEHELKLSKILDIMLYGIAKEE